MGLWTGGRGEPGAPAAGMRGIFSSRCGPLMPANPIGRVSDNSAGGPRDGPGPDRWYVVSKIWRSQSYNELPALSVRGRELRASLRIVTAGWMFGTVWMAAIGGATILNFGDLAGFQDFHWQILPAIGFAATLAQVPASYLIEKTGLRKYQFIHSMTLGRFMWILIGLVPLSLFYLPRTFAIWSLFALTFVGWVLLHLGSPAWTTWMGDLIPQRIRGRYFARRNMYAVAVNLAAVLALGFLFDAILSPSAKSLLDKQVLSAREYPLLVFILSGVFILAGVCGMVDILLFRRVREVARTAPAQLVGLKQIIVEPLSNPRFRHFVLDLGTQTFGVSLSMGLFGPLARKHFELSNVWVNIVLMVAGPIGGILSSRFWGALIDRWGRKPVLVLSTCGLTMAAWGWLLVPPVDPWRYLLPLVTFYGGMIWTGVQMAQFNMMLSFTDDGGRSTYVAASSLIVSLVGLLGSLTGGYLVGVFDGVHIVLGSYVFINYHVMAFLSGAVRAASLIFVFKLEDPGARPTRMMIRQIRTNVYHNMAAMVFMPMRVAGWSAKALYRVNGQGPNPPAETPQDSDEISTGPR